MRAQEILGRLEKVREAGADRWMACCPAHDDRSPSLSVRELEDRILLHCFAGCSSHDITRAIGIQIRDLFAEPQNGKVHPRFEERLQRRVEEARAGVTDDPVMEQLAQAERVAQAMEGLRPVESYEERAADWIIPHVLAKGFMSMIAGDPGVGKSILTYAMIGEITSQSIPVAYMSTENHPSIQVRPMLHAAGANTNEVYIWEDPPSLMQAELITQVLDKLGIGVLVIDTLVPFLEGVDTDKAGEIVTVLKGLRQASMNTDLAVLAVHHLNKDVKARNIQHRVAGSYQFAGQFSHIIAVTQGQDWRTAEVVKSNLGPTGHKLKYAIKEVGINKVIADCPMGITFCQ